MEVGIAPLLKQQLQEEIKQLKQDHAQLVQTLKDEAKVSE